MKIGLYFGSFNPIHVGHLIISNHVLNVSDIDRVWFVVSPQNPLKNETGLLNEYNRLHLVRIAIEDDNRLKASDIEFNLPRPSYTINTLTYLKEKHPNDQFSIIMGSDSYLNIEKWKNYKSIVENYSIYVYRRSGFEIKNEVESNIKIIDAPMLEISATQIRELLKKGKSIRYMVPDKVLEEIERGNYYRR